MNKSNPLNQVRSIDADMLNHFTKVQNKSIQEGSILRRLMDFASSIPDFRRLDKGNFRQQLKDIIMLMILGRLCGCISRADIIEFGKHNIKKISKMNILKNGVPSEATICRVDNGINEQGMSDRMQEFIEGFHSQLRAAECDREIICIDGNALRGTLQENGRNPDIVSAYSFNTCLTLATEACQEKSNEIKAEPLLIDKLDISGKIVTADAMSMQKDIIDKIRNHGADFLIELKANQRSLLYGVEDRLGMNSPVISYTQGPGLSHGRIETRTYRIYDGQYMIADKDKWGGALTVIEYMCYTVKKSTNAQTAEKRLYVSSLPVNTPTLGALVRDHWSIESMHWHLDFNLSQARIRRKSLRSARNLDTIQRIVHDVFSIWKGLRRKRSDKRKGMAELMRHISMSFTRLLHFLNQK